MVNTDVVKGEAILLGILLSEVADLGIYLVWRQTQKKLLQLRINN